MWADQCPGQGREVFQVEDGAIKDTTVTWAGWTISRAYWIGLRPCVLSRGLMTRTHYVGVLACFEKDSRLRPSQLVSRWCSPGPSNSETMGSLEGNPRCLEKFLVDRRHHQRGVTLPRSGANRTKVLTSPDSLRHIAVLGSSSRMGIGPFLRFSLHNRRRIRHCRTIFNFPRDRHVFPRK